MIRSLFAALLIVLLSLAGLTPVHAASTTSELSWGFKASFRSYIATGGTSTPTDAATTASDGTFTWPSQPSTWNPQTGTGSFPFGGTVRFQYPAHGIDLSVSNPRVVLTGGGAGELWWTGPTGTVLGATLGGVTVTGNVIASTSAFFTEAGGTPFTYAAGTALDNVRFTVPASTTPELSWRVSTALVSEQATGVTVVNDRFVFPTVSGSAYSGSVRFTNGVTLANPELRINPDSSGTIVASVSGAAPADVAAVNLAAAVRTDAAASVTYTDAPATAIGTALGLPDGSVLEPVTVTFLVVAPVVVVTPTATSLALAATPELVEGDTLTLAATVTPAAPGTIAYSAGPVIKKVAKGTHTYTATFTPTDGLAFLPSTATVTVTVAAKPAETTKSATTAAKAARAGSLSWGVKASFRSYIVGPIAKGAITTSGASVDGGRFVFPQGKSGYTGSVRFTGHAGALDLTFSDPRVDVRAQTLSMVVTGVGRVTIATLDLPKPTKKGGATRYSNASATLTAAGAAAFDGYYAAGEPLDPVSLVIGSTAKKAAPSVAVATFDAGNTADATPPATSGLDVSADGDQYTVSATGFEPNETGVLVVVYSTPTVLSTDATADATGTVTWSGRLPAALTGEHTLTLQGTVDRGAVITIAEPEPTPLLGCVVDGATLTWGFKESFRSYISGSIANGEWTVSDGATYETPDFGFSGGTGSYDEETGTGEVAFSGGIRFTGHDGLLDTTVANPVVRFDGPGEATLLIDIAGVTQEGAEVEQKGVEFVTFDPTSDAPPVLTSAGAAAFGTYETGEEFDPISIVTDCAVAAAPNRGTVEATRAPVEPVTDSQQGPWVAIAIALGVLLLIAIALIVVLLTVRRRRA